ncbi:MAG: ABC transporter permease [Lachnospiraceae bacterium]|nr:ABC transporter permease [Lachnospiraceae bacterium]
MRISTLIYLIRQGLKNIHRNKMFSLASIATMTACIFLFGLFFAILTNFRHIVKVVEEGVGVTVFFDETLSEDRVRELGKEIEKREEVLQMTYVTEEEAWEEYQQIYFKDNPNLAEGFKEDNPLAGSSHFVILLKDVEKQDALVKYLEGTEGVRKVNHSAVVAHTLTNVNMIIAYISVAIIIVLLAVAIFLIGNTIAMGIAVRREEIAIMKLIGATDSFVRSPFIIEGMIIGLVGSSIPLFIIYILYNRVIQFMAEKFSILSLEFLPVREIFSTLVPTALLIGLGVGLFGSITTIRKHLKV